MELPYLYTMKTETQILIAKGRSNGYGEDEDTGSESFSGSSSPSVGGCRSLKVNLTNLLNIPLTPLNLSFKIITARFEREENLRHVLRYERHHQLGDVSVLFAVRSPGCDICKSHAIQLAALAESDPKVNLLAVVKESGVDDKALLKFHGEDFPHPIYQDHKRRIFKAMGNKKLSKMLVLRTTLGMPGKHMKGKTSRPVPKGDWWTKGGVFVFNQREELCSFHCEDADDKYDTLALKSAIEEARMSQNNP